MEHLAKEALIETEASPAPRIDIEILSQDCGCSVVAWLPSNRNYAVIATSVEEALGKLITQLQTSVGVESLPSVSLSTISERELGALILEASIKGQTRFKIVYKNVDGVA